MKKAWASTPNSVGVLIASDENSEWLLPWFWSRYSSINSAPIAFVDLGMSYFGKSYCQKRGIYIPLERGESFSAESSPVWEELFGRKVLPSAWRKKPLAMLQTPFEKTLWLDLDCEVLDSLDELLSRPEPFLIAQETLNAHLRERSLHLLEEDETLYNSGVILYSHGHPLIEAWAKAVKEVKVASDQHILSRLIHQQNAQIDLLPEIYNWRMTSGINPSAKIIHWVGKWGKQFIRHNGGIKTHLHVCQF